MEKKESTPARESRRKYEAKHKDERKAQYKVWGTSIDRKTAEEMDEFLTKYNLTKVDLISAGFSYLKDKFELEGKKKE